MISDEEILRGLKRYDNNVTKDFFYTYCRMAYAVYDRKYDLQRKAGMDFYSLAHEYYIHLDRHEWKQLEDRPPTTSLKSWLMGGFRFLILDKLKEVEKENRHTTVLEGARNRQLLFSVPDTNFSAEVMKMVDEICYQKLRRDNVSAVILKMILLEGYKGKEVAEKLGITPSAVTQRYKRLMKNVVIPYFKNYYEAVPDMMDGVRLYSFSNFGEDANEGMYYEDAHSKTKAATPPGRFGKLFGILRSTKSTHKSMEKNSIKPEDSNKMFKIKIVRGRDCSNRVAANNIKELKDGEIFVFGSNLAGMHGGGAAYLALKRFGAVWGQGVGLQGNSYAIPTMQGGTDTIAPYVDGFIEFAKQHPELTFLVTQIGCGIAGFDPEDIAPLFEKAIDVDNIHLPKAFWDVLA